MNNFLIEIGSLYSKIYSPWIYFEYFLKISILNYGFGTESNSEDVLKFERSLGNIR